jgi:hypothetical protein
MLALNMAIHNIPPTKMMPYAFCKAVSNFLKILWDN